MNKDSLTHKVRIISLSTGLSFNTVLTHFFLESVIKKLLATHEANHLVIKGGFLLANLIGITYRSTVDIDILVQGMTLDELQITEIARQLSETEICPEVQCRLQSIEPIRLEDEYGGFRAKIFCQLENITQVIPLDFATGDPITPSKVALDYRCIFYDELLPIFSYNDETVIAEKLETMLRRGIANSRSKDFYDLHILWTLRKSELRISTLSSALTNTFSYRKKELNYAKIHALLADLRADRPMAIRWKAWQVRNPYARDLQWQEAVDSIETMIRWLESEFKDQ